MILNLSGKKLEDFNVMQAYACNGQTVVSPKGVTAENVFDVIDRYKNVSIILVDTDDWELVNDICNYTDAKVCTLDIDVHPDRYPSVRFQEYDYNEHSA